MPFHSKQSDHKTGLERSQTYKIELFSKIDLDMSLDCTIFETTPNFLSKNNLLK